MIIRIIRGMKTFWTTFFIFTFVIPGIAQTADQNAIGRKEGNEQWRVLADSGRYHEAINILMDSIHMSKQKNRNRKSDYWHAGQLFAFNNEYDSAIVYIKKSTGFFDTLLDREWRLYYKGTLAFLKRDKKKLRHEYDKLSKKHSDYYYFNTCKLKALYDNFDQPYRVAYDPAL